MNGKNRMKKYYLFVIGFAAVFVAMLALLIFQSWIKYWSYYPVPKIEIVWYSAQLFFHEIFPYAILVGVALYFNARYAVDTIGFSKSLVKSFLAVILISFFLFSWLAFWLPSVNTKLYSAMVHSKFSNNSNTTHDGSLFRHQPPTSDIFELVSCKDSLLKDNENIRKNLVNELHTWSMPGTDRLFSEEQLQLLGISRSDVYINKPDTSGYPIVYGEVNATINYAIQRTIANNRSMKEFDHKFFSIVFYPIMILC